MPGATHGDSDRNDVERVSASAPFSFGAKLARFQQRQTAPATASNALDADARSQASASGRRTPPSAAGPKRKRSVARGASEREAALSTPSGERSRPANSAVAASAARTPLGGSGGGGRGAAPSTFQQRLQRFHARQTATRAPVHRRRTKRSPPSPDEDGGDDGDDNNNNNDSSGDASESDSGGDSDGDAGRVTFADLEREERVSRQIGAREDRIEWERERRARRATASPARAQRVRRERDPR